jgi:hypothetical protein
MGHEVGDHIQRASPPIAQSVRGDDFRHPDGGDEVSPHSPGIRSKEEAALVAKRDLACFKIPSP